MVDLSLFILAACCVLVAMAQWASLAGWPRLIVAFVIGCAFVSAGEAASGVSPASIARWLSEPERRMDLAALLLFEALFFGSHAFSAVRYGSGRLGQWLAWVPPPSLIVTLFFAEVWIMLSVDGWRYDVLAWACGATFAVLVYTGAGVIRALLPDALMRSGMRVLLHVAQVSVVLWLARPAQPAPDDATPIAWAPLGVLAVIAFGFMALGWLCQRRLFFGIVEWKH